LDKYSHTNDTRTPLFIFERLCNLIHPIIPEVDCYLILEKTPSQEDFIRGMMTKNPYLSSDIGVTMRDVKNKVSFFFFFFFFFFKKKKNT